MQPDIKVKPVIIWTAHFFKQIDIFVVVNVDKIGSTHIYLAGSALPVTNYGKPSVLLAPRSSVNDVVFSSSVGTILF